MKIFSTILLALIQPITSLAHTGEIQNFTCPICDEEFKAEQDLSGTALDTRLDFKQIGPIAQPWKLPQCPKCKFVIYDENLSPEKIKELKTFVYSDKYTQIDHKNTPYFYFSQIQLFNKEEPFDVAFILLSASWEAEEDPELYEKYVKMTIASFKSAQESLRKDNSMEEEYFVAIYLQIELNRRLSDFDKSIELARKLLKSDTGVVPRLYKAVDLQIKLCEAKDSGPHNLSELDETND